MKSLVKLANDAGIASWKRTQRVFGALALGTITLEDAELAVAELVRAKHPA